MIRLCGRGVARLRIRFAAYLRGGGGGRGSGGEGARRPAEGVGKGRAGVGGSLGNVGRLSLTRVSKHARAPEDVSRGFSLRCSCMI